MAKVFRLRSARDFKFLYQGGKRTESPSFRVFIKKNSMPHSRFAFVAPKSINKRATVRNRLRRRASEWVRRHPELLNASCDTLILFKKEAVLMPRQQFYEEFKKTIERAFQISFD